MHHWYHRRAAPLIALIVLQRVSTNSAASIWPAINETSPAVTLQGRANVDVLKDKYFIPAIAAIGAFVILALICCYWLGWCFNSRRMDRYYSRTAYPTPTTTTNTRPPVNLNAVQVDGADGELDKEITRRVSNVQRKPTPSSTQSSVPGSPVSTTTAQALPPGIQYPATNNWQQYSYTSSGQRPQMAPVSHGFQTMPSTIMSVQHLNPTVASYYANRGQHVQHPATTQAPSQFQTQLRSDIVRTSTVSSADSSTQIGSAAGEQVPYLYSPHQGNTLSYVSSGAPSVQAMPRVSDWRNASLPPQDGSSRPDPQIPPTEATSSLPTGPPAYVGDGSGYPQDKKSREKAG